MIVPSFLRSRAFLTAAALILLVSLASTRIPLLNYLGYEASFVFALVFSLAAGLLAIRWVRQAYQAPEADQALVMANTMRALWSSLRANLLLLLIPLAVLTANALVVRNCSFADGLAFFLLLPAVSACFSTALGFFCAVHYRHPKSVFFLIGAATFAYDIALGYFTPAIFSYNFFYGYFPGLTYDEALTPTLTLFLFRIITLGVAAVLTWMGYLLVTRARPSDPVTVKGALLIRLMIRPEWRVLTGAIVLAAVLLVLFRCRLGFESTEGFIRDELGGHFRSDHFEIIYARGTYTPEEIRRVAEEHEFRLSQIMHAFSLVRVETITSFIYPSAELKGRLLGAANTDFAKPWSHQLHVTRQSLEATLKHEMTHVLAGRFGLPVIHASLSTGLVEGLAMAIEWDWGNRTLHQYSAAIRRSGLEPDITSLMQFSGFAANSSSLSYVLAGSFCRYLIDTYSIRLMMQLYGSGDYDRLYGKALPELIGGWHDFLDQMPAAGTDSALVDVLFRHPAIFGKVCARVIGERNAAASRAYARGEYAAAEGLFARSYDEGRGYEALRGLLASALRLGHYATLTSVMDTLIRRAPHPDMYDPLLVGVGDAYWATGSPASASPLLARVHEVNFSEAYSEAAGARILGMRDTLNSGAFLRYFLSPAPDTVRMIMLDSILTAAPRELLARYLKGRILLRTNHAPESAATLDSVDMMPLDPRLEAIRLKSIGYARYRLGDFQRAKEAFWLSLNADDSPASQDEVEDWVERCEWMSGRE